MAGQTGCSSSILTYFSTTASDNNFTGSQEPRGNKRSCWSTTMSRMSTSRSQSRNEIPLPFHNIGIPSYDGSQHWNSSVLLATTRCSIPTPGHNIDNPSLHWVTTLHFNLQSPSEHRITMLTPGRSNPRSDHNTECPTLRPPSTLECQPYTRSQHWSCILRPGHKTEKPPPCPVATMKIHP